MSTVTTVTEDLRARAADEAREKQEAFRRLVKQLADGQKITPDEAGKILADAGKTVDDLEKAIKLKHDRRAWAAQMRLAEKALGESKTVEQEMARLEEEKRAAIVAFDARRQELEARLSTLHHQVSDGNFAAGKLRETADPELLAQIAEVRKLGARFADPTSSEERRHEAEVESWRREQAKLLEKAAEHERRSRQYTPDSDAAIEHREEAESLRRQAVEIGKRIARREAHWAAIEEDKAAVFASADELEQQLLVP